MHFRNNQKGFTLLELLVSVAILSILIVPFGFAFVTTTKINSDTKERERAKFAATNLMEDVHSRSIKSILADDDDSDGNITVAETDSDGKATGRYYYAEQQVIDGKTYYVEALLDPTRGTETGDIDEATDYNVAEFAKLYNMNSAYDAFCTYDANGAEATINQLAEAAYLNNSAPYFNNVCRNVSRIINVHITKSDEGIIKVYSNASYTFVSAGQSHTVDTSEQIIYSGSSANLPLRGVYLFYDPLYASMKDENGDDVPESYGSTLGIAKETFDIINESDSPCTFYLVEQYDRNDAVSKSYHDNHKVKVRLAEPNRSTPRFNDDGSVNVLTNIRTNIESTIYTDSSNTMKYAEFTDDYAGKTTKIAFDVGSGSLFHKNKLDLYYASGANNANIYNYGYGFSDASGNLTPAADMMGLDDMAGLDSYEIVYEVTARVYGESDIDLSGGDSLSDFVARDRTSDASNVYTLKTTTQ